MDLETFNKAKKILQEIENLEHHYKQIRAVFLEVENQDIALLKSDAAEVFISKKSAIAALDIEATCTLNRIQCLKAEFKVLGNPCATPIEELQIGGDLAAEENEPLTKWSGHYNENLDKIVGIPKEMDTFDPSRPCYPDLDNSEEALEFPDAIDEFEGKSKPEKFED